MNRNIYVILTRTDTILSRLIRFIKRDEYSHASISLDKSLHEMYSFGRKNTYNPFIGCFVKEELNKGVFGFTKELNGVVIEISVSEKQYERAEKLLSEFKANGTHYKYNYIGLLHSLLNMESCSENRFLCSEFVYYILNKSDITNFNVPRNLVRPENLLNLNGRIIFEGNLKHRYLRNYKIEYNFEPS